MKKKWVGYQSFGKKCVDEREFSFSLGKIKMVFEEKYSTDVVVIVAVALRHFCPDMSQYFWNNFYPFPPKTKEDTTKYDLQHKTIFNLQGSATGNGTCYYFCQTFLNMGLLSVYFLFYTVFFTRKRTNLPSRKTTRPRLFLIVNPALLSLLLI